MILEVRNLGPIKRASIDLSKKVFLFAGLNKSGKTLLSKFIWSLYAALSKPLEFLDADLDSDLWKEVELSSFANFEVVEEFLIDIIERKLKEFKPHLALNVPRDSWVVNNLKYRLSPNLKNFGVNAKEGESVHYIVGRSSQIIFTYDRNSSKVRIDVNSFDSDLIPHYQRNLTWYLLEQIGGLQGPTFIPASRLLFTSYYEYLNLALKDQRDEINNIIVQGGSSQELSRYKLPFAPSELSLLRSIDRIRITTRTIDHGAFYDDLANQLLEMFGVELTVNSPAELTDKVLLTYAEKQHEGTPIHNSPSSVGQIASLYLYLKAWVNKGHNFLLLDEPEMNLHLSSQKSLTHLLMKFAGYRQNKVVVTTHSPYLADLLNSYSLFTQLSDKDKEEYKASGLPDLETGLPSDSIAIYVFDERGATEVPITEFGFFLKQFADCEREVRNMATALMDLNQKKATS